jgi:hypothetical protein
MNAFAVLSTWTIFGFFCWTLWLDDCIKRWRRHAPSSASSLHVRMQTCGSCSGCATWRPSSAGRSRVGWRLGLLQDVVGLGLEIRRLGRRRDQKLLQGCGRADLAVRVRFHRSSQECAICTRAWAIGRVAAAAMDGVEGGKGRTGLADSISWLSPSDGSGWKGRGS